MTAPHLSLKDVNGGILSISQFTLYGSVKDGRRPAFIDAMRPDEASKLYELVKDINCHVNLIPVNPIKERNYKRSSMKNINNFKSFLERKGVNVTVRREMGSDIQGACGQLRKSFIEEET